MRRYMENYRVYLESFLQNPDPGKLPALRREILVQIGFMQHERLIHFLVTMLFALLFMLAMGIFLFFPSAGMAVLVILLLVLLIPYIGHYYYLENTVQKLYLLYNKAAALEDDLQYPNTQMLEKL